MPVAATIRNLDRLSPGNLTEVLPAAVVVAGRV
jgi:hypothetical protein